MSQKVEKENNVEEKEEMPNWKNRTYFKLWIGMLSISVVLLLFVFFAIYIPHQS